MLRFGSLYGPRANNSNGACQLLFQALEKRKIDYYGTGDKIREYIHILDAVAMSVDVPRKWHQNGSEHKCQLLYDEISNDPLHLKYCDIVAR